MQTWDVATKYKIHNRCRSQFIVKLTIFITIQTWKYFQGYSQNKNYNHKDGFYLAKTLDVAKALFAFEVSNSPSFLFSIHQHQKFVVLMFKYDPDDESDLLKRYNKNCINLMEPPINHERIGKIVKYFSRIPIPGTNFVTAIIHVWRPWIAAKCQA